MSSSIIILLLIIILAIVVIRFMYDFVMLDGEGFVGTHERPWTVNESWRTGVVSQTTTFRSLINGWMLLTVLIVVLRGAIDIAIRELPTGRGIIWRGISLLLLWLAFVSIRYVASSMSTWTLYRSAKLKLETLPGVLGGEFKGVIQLPRPLQGTQDVKLTIHCRKGIRGIVWKDEQKFLSQDIIPQTQELAVRFAIPYDCEPSYGRKVSWIVCAHIGIAKIRFNVPIFRTEQSDKSITRETIVVGLPGTALLFWL